MPLDIDKKHRFSMNIEPIPPKPDVHPFLNARIATLPPESIAMLGAIYEEYQEAMVQYGFELQSWTAKNNAMGGSLEYVLATEHRMINHPRRRDIYKVAWEFGNDPEVIAELYGKIVDLFRN